MLIADSNTARVTVDVERSCARKVQYNARGAIGRDVISVLHLYANTLHAQWVDMVVLLAIQQYNAVVVCLHISFCLVMPLAREPSIVRIVLRCYAIWSRYPRVREHEG
jgi:hypothetical protein